MRFLLSQVRDWGGPRRRTAIVVAATAVALVATAPAHAQSPSKPPPPDPSIGRVEVSLDLPKDKPYVGEMIMLRMRSFIRADVVRDEIQQPPLINFDAQQLGRDKPIQAMIDGFNVDGVERDIAIFPEQSGRLIIPAFTRHVTISDRDGQRVETEFASKPVFVDVQNYTSINKADAWWLPAKTLTFTDSWTPEADAIERGQLSRRTITIEAVGMTADRLPPPPDMRAPGVISFKGPTERKTIITEDGPVARATYQWDMRPTIGQPAQVPAIHLPWFDTGERRMRDAALPERWVAYIGTLVHPSHEKVAMIGLLSPGPILAGLAGFAWVAALIALAATSRQPLRGGARRRARLVAALSRAARFNDEPAFRRALAALARSDPPRHARVSGAPDLAPGLAALDGARYGRAGGTVPPLRPLAAGIARHWHAAEPQARPERSALPPIDGDARPPAPWWEGMVARLRPTVHRSRDA